MRLQTVDISNFFGFDPVVVRFDEKELLSPIVGPNGSGKTRLLKAIKWLVENFPSNCEATASNYVEWRNHRCWNSGKASHLILTFKLNQTEQLELSRWRVLGILYFVLIVLRKHMDVNPDLLAWNRRMAGPLDSQGEFGSGRHPLWSALASKLQSSLSSSTPFHFVRFSVHTFDNSYSLALFPAPEILIEDMSSCNFALSSSTEVTEVVNFLCPQPTPPSGDGAAFPLTQDAVHRLLFDGSTTRTVFHALLPPCSLHLPFVDLKLRVLQWVEQVVNEAYPGDRPLCQRLVHQDGQPDEHTHLSDPEHRHVGKPDPAAISGISLLSALMRRSCVFAQQDRSTRATVRPSQGAVACWPLPYVIDMARATSLAGRAALLSLSEKSHWSELCQALSSVLGVTLVAHLDHDGRLQMMFKNRLATEVRIDWDEASGGETDVFIALAATLLSDGDNVFLDEPGHSLQSPAQSRLCRVLIHHNQSRRRTLVVVTHSQEFVTFETLPFLRRVVYNCVYTMRPNSLEPSECKTICLANTRRIFFSHEVLLVEGIGDQLAMEALLDAQDDSVRCDRVVSILPLGGCGNSTPVIRACIQLGIPVCTFHDIDVVFNKDHVMLGECTLLARMIPTDSMARPFMSLLQAYELDVRSRSAIIQELERGLRHVSNPATYESFYAALAPFRQLVWDRTSAGRPGSGLLLFRLDLEDLFLAGDPFIESATESMLHRPRSQYYDAPAAGVAPPPASMVVGALRNILRLDAHWNSHAAALYAMLNHDASLVPAVREVAGSAVPLCGEQRETVERELREQCRVLGPHYPLLAYVGSSVLHAISTQPLFRDGKGRVCVPRHRLAAKLHRWKGVMLADVTELWQTRVNGSPIVPPFPPSLADLDRWQRGLPALPQ